MFNQAPKVSFESYFRLVLIGLLLCLLASPAMAKKTEVGLVLMATLGVTAEQPNTEPRKLTRRSAIFLGDTLKTPKGGRVQLRMADGEMISLMESSELVIEAFSYQSKIADEKDSNVKSLVTGGLRTITGAVKGDNYEMKSRAGTIGIRGTAFEAYTQQGQNLFVRMQSGQVVVKNNQGSVAIGMNLPLSAARILGANQSPEAIPATQLPAFFQQAFTQDASLSLADDQPQDQQQDPEPTPQNQPAEPQDQTDQPTPRQQRLAINQPLVTGGAPVFAPLPLSLGDSEPFEDLAKKAVEAAKLASNSKPDQPPVTPPSAPPVVPPLPPLEPMGDFGYVFVNKDSLAYGGGFVGMPDNMQEGVGVKVVGSEGSALANPNVNLINSFDFLIETRLVELPYSAIYVGGAPLLGRGSEFKINGQEEVAQEGGIIFATNVHNTIDTLPTLDHDYTYSLLSGVLEANGLNTGLMQVNFSTGDMSVRLDSSGYRIYTGQGKVAQFYNNSISLQDTQNEMLKGSITGRFVGPDAEGAITFYSFDSGSIDPVTGVGFFDRTGVNTPPP